METVKTFKIAADGAGGSGKDTFINESQKRLAHLNSCVYLTEAAEEYFAKNPTLPEDRSLMSVQEAIQSLAKKKEEEGLSKNPLFLWCNRTIFSGAVYSRFYGRREDSETLYRRAVEWGWHDSYSIVFLMSPKGVPHVRTSIRLEDETFRERLHETYLEFFEEKKIEYQLLEGSLKDKVDRAINTIFKRSGYVDKISR